MGAGVTCGVLDIWRLRYLSMIDESVWKRSGRLASRYLRYPASTW